MIKLNKETEIKNNWAVITAIYKGSRYTSIPLELVPNSDNIRLLITLSEGGTNGTQMLKFPISETKFMVFSKDQLIETLFEIEIFAENPSEKPAKTTKAKKTPELLKS